MTDISRIKISLLWLLCLIGCSHLNLKGPSESQKMIGNEAQYQEWVLRSKSVDWDDLSQAHHMTRKYRQDYPTSPHAIYMDSVMAADYAELLPPDEEKNVKEKTVKDLYSLMENLADFSLRMRSAIRNEYYYHSNRFLDQYLLGCEQLKDFPSDGNFSIGVGASEYAYTLIQKGDIKEARKFAKLAVESWQAHAKLEPKWAYPYPYFYIQALVIAGEYDLATAEMDSIKKTKQYTLKKPIYNKYEARFSSIRQALTKTENN